MKDSSKMLNFNLDRPLNFDTTRGVDFDNRRTLEFDLNRALSFDVNRDLGIRKRGVVFRGYVCPVCGAPVAIDAPRCEECGVEFEDSKKQEEEKREWANKKAGKKKQPPGKKRASTHKKPPQKKEEYRETFSCPICNTFLYIGTAVCPTCGARFDSNLPPPPPPQNSGNSVTVSWDEYNAKSSRDRIRKW